MKKLMGMILCAFALAGCDQAVDGTADKFGFTVPMETTDKANAEVRI